MANRRGAVIVVLIGLAGCGQRSEPPPVGEQIDPSERYLVPSIVASARRLVDEVQKESGPLYRRDAHAKAHGCLTATFTVREDLPEAMRTGVFVPGRQYQAWIRFSNGNAELQPDYDKDARGMAIKLMGVAGPKLLDSPADDDAQTQDFLMINFPVFFNRSPAEYERFIRYQADGSQFGYFFAGRNPLDWRWRELFIGGQLLGRIRNPLYAQYYSMTSYAMGVDAAAKDDPKPYRHAMKYSAKSCTPPDGRTADVADDDYLRRGLVEHLSGADGCFEFLVQLQDTKRDMPVEDPTVRWKESQAPFVRVADIHIPAQEFDTPSRNPVLQSLARPRGPPSARRPEPHPQGGVRGDRGVPARDERLRDLS